MVLSKRFKITQLNKATDDLDNAINYYNSKQIGLGKRFYLEYKKTLKTIKTNPYYRVFYDDIHCLQIGIFPYLIHYTINESNKFILVEAVICTHKDPVSAYLKR